MARESSLAQRSRISELARESSRDNNRHRRATTTTPVCRRSRRDKVDANGRELERQISCHGRHRGRESRDESESLRRATATCAAHEEQCPSRANFVCGVSSDLQWEKQVGLDVAACFFKIEFGRGA
jgi:hypothetical protein